MNNEVVGLQETVTFTLFNEKEGSLTVIKRKENKAEEDINED